MNNQAKFLEAHRIARLTRHIVGDYQVAFTIALRDLNKPVTLTVQRDIDVDWVLLVLVSITFICALIVGFTVSPFHMIAVMITGVVVSFVIYLLIELVYAVYIAIVERIYTVVDRTPFDITLIK